MATNATLAGVLENNTSFAKALREVSCADRDPDEEMTTLRGMSRSIPALNEWSDTPWNVAFNPTLIISETSG